MIVNYDRKTFTAQSTGVDVVIVLSLSLKLFSDKLERFWSVSDEKKFFTNGVKAGGIF